MSNLNEQETVSESVYLAGELTSETKYQLIDGQVYAMAGASANHDRIATNLLIKFGTHLKNSTGEPFGSDMKVKANANFFYPDVIVVCDFDESQPVFTDSPTIIVEVLSKSTRKIDETTKRVNYINLPSLQEYVLIEQDFVDIEVVRKSEGWQSKRYFLGDTITFESIGITLSVADIYHRVKNQDMNEFLTAQQT
jgi:Uma2 family endonuclease